MSHTPGPWKVKTQGSSDDCIVRTVTGPRGGGGDEVAIVTTGSYDDSTESANALLIAAALELLAACKMAYTPISEEYDVDRQPDGDREYPFQGAGEILNALRAAIDKAEGK